MRKLYHDAISYYGRSGIYLERAHPGRFEDEDVAALYNSDMYPITRHQLGYATTWLGFDL